jgi:hypothetical protein
MWQSLILADCLLDGEGRRKSPMSLRLRLRLASLAFAVAVPTVAAAQPTAAPGAAAAPSPYYQPAAQPAPVLRPYHAPRPRRVGWELDVAAQAGEINCSGALCNDFREAGGLSAGATYMIGPRLGINGQIWGMAHSNDGWTVAQVITTVGVELRPFPILSLQAGVGHAHAHQSWDFGNVAVGSDDAPAFMIGASLDVVRARTWALDVQLKFGTGFYDDEDGDGDPDVIARNIGLGVGVTFF